MKMCPKCGKTRALSEFCKNRTKPDGLQVVCKQCFKKYPGARRPGYERDRKIKARYGLTPADFDALVASQGGVCAGCAGPLPFGTKQIHVDHDHATGKVRGVLCWPCNRRLGTLESKPELNAKLVQYLKRHGVDLFWPQPMVGP